MPGGIKSMRPTMSRNELAWLATLDDVESRIVFTERGDDKTRYRVDTGPFDSDYLQGLPKSDWSLLVHDVEKHLPAMRRLFEHVPFIPDWRIDDLMISFAAPGGGVGPHKDNYDVFLCQGTGIRDWRYSTEAVEEDPTASNDLALLREFAHGESQLARNGDVLYLPPGVAHWGTAKRACLTYSIGMRAPSFYADPDLGLHEVQQGYISPEAHERAGAKAGELGCLATELKQWLQPEVPVPDEISEIMQRGLEASGLSLHGMTRIAYDNDTLYVNGSQRPLLPCDREPVATLCACRKLDRATSSRLDDRCLRWLLAQGTFALADQD